MRPKSPFLVALTDPLNLAMLGLTFAAGLCSAWWLLPIGFLLWLAMVLIVARDPALRMSQVMQDRAGLAQRFQRPFDRIERTQVSIFNAISHADPRMRQALQPVRAATDELVDRAYRLGQQMTVLENHRMVSQANTDFESALAELAVKIEGATDPMVRQEYEESRQALQNRLASLEALDRQLERTEAQLGSLASELDTVLTEIIRLQAMGPQQARSQVPELVRRLARHQQELDAFERKAQAL
jgi:chromosome segregation ATPase